MQEKQRAHIMSTKDYSLFKFDLPNREIYEKHVLNLMKGINEKNKLHLHPVIVIKAAERLGIPLFYMIDQSGSVEDIKEVNVNQRKWTLDDYVEYYCKQGNSDFLELRDLIETHKLTLNVVYYVANSSGQAFQDLRQGKVRVNFDKVNNFFNQVMPFIHEIKSKLNKDLIPILSTRFFFKALYSLKEEFPSQFEKILYALDRDFFKIRICASVRGYMHHMISIYNSCCRNKKISLEKYL